MVEVNDAVKVIGSHPLAGKILQVHTVHSENAVGVTNHGIRYVLYDFQYEVVPQPGATSREVFSDAVLEMVPDEDEE